jgi:hypothetical protein
MRRSTWQNSHSRKNPTRTNKRSRHVAQRKAELAGWLAMAADKAKREKADADYLKQQAEMVTGEAEIDESEAAHAETLVTPCR